MWAHKWVSARYIYINIYTHDISQRKVSTTLLGSQGDEEKMTLE